MTSLTAPGAARFLLDRGLLDPGAVLDGLLRVEAAPGRHRNFRLEGGPGRGWFLKRGPGGAGRGPSLLSVEAGLHRLSAGDPRFRGLARHLPRLGLFDPETDTLVMELLGRGGNLALASRRGPDLPEDLARAAGGCLGALHRDLLPAAAAPAGVLADRLPWVLDSIHGPVPASRGGGAADEVLAAAASHPAVASGRAAIRERWRRETLIHGDVKGANLVVAREGARGRPPVVRLVDWECASLGDGAWDLGSAFHDHWYRAALPGGDRARHPEAALRALWRGYLRARGKGAGGRERLEQAVRCGGLRLVQSAYELARVDDGGGGRAWTLLEAAVRILRRPGQHAAAVASRGRS